MLWTEATEQFVPAASDIKKGGGKQICRAQGHAKNILYSISSIA